MMKLYPFTTNIEGLIFLPLWLRNITTPTIPLQSLIPLRLFKCATLSVLSNYHSPTFLYIASL